MAEFKPSVWRSSIVPLDQPSPTNVVLNQPPTKTVAFLAKSAAVVATVRPGGQALAIGADAVSPVLQPANAGWAVQPGALTSANVMGSTFLTRGPMLDGDGKVGGQHHQTLLIGYPADDKKLCGENAACAYAGHGEALRLYDPVANTTAQLDPIAPRSGAATDFVVNVTAIDLGSGPVLLYWLDVSAKATSVSLVPGGAQTIVPGTAVVMGRLIYPDGAQSNDFLVSQIAPPTAGACQGGATKACEYDLVAGGGFWGDYHTASGFGPPIVAGDVLKPPVSLVKPRVYRFYPTWSEPTRGVVEFAEVTVDLTIHIASNGAALRPLAGAAGLVAVRAPPAKRDWIKDRRLTPAEISRFRSRGDLDAPVRQEAVRR